MKRRQSLILATALLLLAAGLRLWNLGTLPPGFSDAEIGVLNVAARTRQGEIMVFHQANGQNQETLFHILQGIASGLMGDGLITLRIVPVGAGLVTLALVYALTRRLHGKRAAWLALGLMAVGFWPILLSRLSMRETLIPLFTVAVLLAFAHTFHIRREVSPDPPNTTSYAMLGVLTALSLYAHWVGLLLVAFVTLGLLYLFLTRQRISRRTAGYSAFAILISIIITMPYVVTTLRAPDLSALATLRADLAPDSVPTAVLDGLAALFLRGDATPAVNLPGRPLLDPISGLLLLIGLGMGLRGWRLPASLLLALGTLIGLIPALLAACGCFLLMAGALPLIYIVIACAADHLLDSLTLRRPALRRAAPWLMAALVVANLAWTGLDLFGAWPANDGVREAYHASRGLLAHHLDRTAGQTPSVICSPQLQDTTTRVGDMTLLPLMMQRTNVPLRYLDCANGMLIAEGGTRQQFAFTDLATYDQMHGVLRSWLRNRPEIPVPGLERRSVVELDVQRQLGNTVGRLLTTAPTRWAPEGPGGPGLAELPVRFGGNLTFLGYVPERDLAYRPGAVVTMLTYWRVDGPVPPDVRILIHVLADPAAAPVAQNQAINVWTPSLRNRDVFLQISYVVLPDSTPPGEYDLSVIAYQADSQRRLPVFDGERVRGDRLLLYQIRVVSEDGG